MMAALDCDRRSKFTQEQQGRLVELFEQYGHLSKGYLEGIVEGLGEDAGFSEGQVRRELRALGLRRGQPTARQVSPGRAKQGKALWDPTSTLDSRGLRQGGKA